MKRKVICWFRRDLRLSDNAALTSAAAAGQVVPLFVVDEVLRAQGAATRWRMERSVAALAASIALRGGRLVLRAGDAAEAVAAVARESGATEVHATDWPEPSRRAADRRVAQALAAIGVRFCLHQGHTLLPPDSLRTGAGTPFKVFTPFLRALQKHGVSPPAPVPRDLNFAAPLPGLDPSALDLAPDMNRGAAVLARHSLAVGESAAMARLHAFAGTSANYAGDRDRPDRSNATSGLSEALACGEISPRTIWDAAEALARDPGMAASAAKFRAEVAWRDFAWSLLTTCPDLPRTEWRPEWRDFPWRDAPAETQRWRRAATGEPFVDAGLRELYVTGRMHNRVRLIVASYLCKHLLIDWRVGQNWFADTLTDWDPASNAMNWQWVAGCGPDAAPFFRIFNPRSQADRFDPDGAYRARWLWGWQGNHCEDAGEWFRAVPRSWDLSPDQPDRPPMVDLGFGRTRALAALASLKGRNASEG